MGTLHVGRGNGIGEGFDRPQEGEPDSPSINLGDLTLTGKSAGLVAEPDRQRFRNCPPETVTGSRDRHHHLTARLHCCLIEGPGGAGVILRSHRKKTQQPHHTRYRTNHHYHYHYHYSEQGFPPLVCFVGRFCSLPPHRLCC